MISVEERVDFAILSLKIKESNNQKAVKSRRQLQKLRRGVQQQTRVRPRRFLSLLKKEPKIAQCASHTPSVDPMLNASVEAAHAVA